jgi:hypothetical protein
VVDRMGQNFFEVDAAFKNLAQPTIVQEDAVREARATHLKLWGAFFEKYSYSLSHNVFGG